LAEVDREELVPVGRHQKGGTVWGLISKTLIESPPANTPRALLAPQLASVFGATISMTPDAAYMIPITHPNAVLDAIPDDCAYSRMIAE
jgi:hypothetical protein